MKQEVKDKEIKSRKIQIKSLNQEILYHKTKTRFKE